MARIAFIYFFFFFFYFTIDSQFLPWEESPNQKLLLARDTHYDAVVALDGTGNFTKIMDAVKAAPNSSMERFRIFIKKGMYNETVLIDQKKQNILMNGEGIDATIISGNLSYGRNKLKTDHTATFRVKGSGFIAQGISFQNTAGPEGEQAVAMMSESDFSVFYQCEFSGYQDTLYAHSGRQFYKECVIHGTVDFIFGYASAVFQDCQVFVRKGKSTQKNTITAHGGRGDKTITPYGFSFQFCKIYADSNLLPVINSTQTFLGRPWKPHSTTVFMQSYIGELLSPKGWLEWNGSTNLDTLYYAEYNNYGPGASVGNRVKWGTYHVLTDTSQASNFTVARFILGNQWLPSTNVPYTPGLTREQ